MVNKNRTSQKVVSLAVDVLKDRSSSMIEKRLAGSALSQYKTGKQTGGEMEEVASNVLRSNKYSEDTKDLAASILSQSNKARHN